MRWIRSTIKMADEAWNENDDFSIFSSRFVVITMTCSVFAIILFYIHSYKYSLKKNGEVIVFTRYPVPGKSKTRLIPAIGPEAAAKVQVCMTEHIVRMLQRAYMNMGKNISVTLQFNGGTISDMDYWLQRKLWGLPCIFRQQTGNSLGDKLKNAIKESFTRGNRSVVVIGADIPGISEGIIQMAFEVLTMSDKDMVIGKAEDGGYYLVGFSVHALKYIDEIFDNIDWGTDKVFHQQVNNAANLGASIKVLTTVLQDVDTVEDLCVFEKEVGMSCKQLQDNSWSIIVPALNEEKNILSTLNNIQNACSEVRNIQEVVVSDGGSSDKTRLLVEEFSKHSRISVRLVNSKPGRGRQLIMGVENSTGNNFLFLHADTKLPQNFDQLASNCLSTPGVVAGAFRFQLDILEKTDLTHSEPWWFVLQMKALVWGTNIRATKYEKPYGDQAMFITKQAYRTVGGFPPYFLMEDYIMNEKLWTIGHIKIVDGPPVVTSYRRWRKYGYLKVTGLSQLIILAYKLGVHPNRLAQWYYGDKVKIE